MALTACLKSMNFPEYKEDGTEDLFGRPGEEHHTGKDDEGWDSDLDTIFEEDADCTGCDDVFDNFGTENMAEPLVYEEDGFFDGMEQFDVVGCNRYILVEYNGIAYDDLNKIEKLSKTDCVFIYYNDSSDMLPFRLHKKIKESNAHVECINVQMPISDNIECRIWYDIRDLARKHPDAQYVIISRQSFSCNQIFELFRARGIDVHKYEEISSLGVRDMLLSVVEKVKRKKEREVEVRAFMETVFEACFGDLVCEKEKEYIIEVLLDAKSKQGVNNALCRCFPSSVVSEILKILKPIIKDLPGR
jgi:hypothetical protein